MERLFTIGPVEMFPSTLDVRHTQIPYFRTPEFSRVVLESETMLKELSNAPESARFVFLTGSGTAAMEAVVMDGFDSSDKVLVINGGTFGQRFVELCEHHELKYEAIELSVGETLKQHHLDPYVDGGFSALLVNSNETSTGQLYDLDMLSRFCSDQGLVFIVDSIGSFAADPLDADALGIDSLIISSQKAMSLSPGLSMVMLSARMQDRVSSIPPKTFYLSLREHLAQGERGQTPYTPAVGVVHEMHDRLAKLAKSGMAYEVQRVADLARDFRNRIAGTTLSLPTYPLSNALTPVFFPEPIAMQVYEELRKDYGLVLNPGGGPNSQRLLRVGHLGALEPKDYDELVSYLLERFKA